MIRLTRVLLALVFTAASAHAQTAERFLIERIEVRNLHRASPDIVKAESRLHEDHDYSESELHDASSRIRRLPFVLDADLSLEKGTRRDSYVLVITVNETRPLFFREDLVFLTGREDALRVESDNSALLGGRLFAGRNGVVHLGFIGHDEKRPFGEGFSALQAGYTHYNLVGGRAFATVTLNRYLGPDPSGTRPGALVGISLSPNQTLTLSYTDIVSGFGPHRSSRIFESRLSYNTTNHPFFPTDGTLLSVAPVLAWTDTLYDKTSIPNPPNAVHSFDSGLDGQAARFWPLGTRNSLATIVQGGFVRIDRHGDGIVENARVARYGSATIRVYHRLGGDAAPGEAERRLELALRAVSDEKESTPFVRDEFTQVSVSWVRRNAWGMLRFGVGWAW